MVVKAVKMENKKKTLTEVLSYLLKLVIRSFLIAVFIIGLLLMVLLFSDSAANFQEDGTGPRYLTYVIVTESMVPTIKVNDAVVVKRVKENQIQIGDIITFLSKNKYGQKRTITHRVVGKQFDDSGNYIYRTKGDNNIVEDTSLVSSESIYGKVVLKIPKIGYIKQFVSSPKGFVLSILVPILLVIIYEIYRIIKAIRIRNKKIETL